MVDLCFQNENSKEFPIRAPIISKINRQIIKLEDSTIIPVIVLQNICTNFFSSETFNSIQIFKYLNLLANLSTSKHSSFSAVLRLLLGIYVWQQILCSFWNLKVNILLFNFYLNSHVQIALSHQALVLDSSTTFQGCGCLFEIPKFMFIESSQLCLLLNFVQILSNMKA